MGLKKNHIFLNAPKQEFSNRLIVIFYGIKYLLVLSTGKISKITIYQHFLVQIDIS